MKNEFVPYDIALTMKELGFDEKCLGVYYPDLTDNVEWIPSDMFNREAFIEKGFIKAPLYQQAFRWFREKYKMKLYIREDIWNDWCTVKILSRKEYDNDYIDEGDYKTYPEAELACLRRLIEIVKDKRDEK